ncbi:MIP/aquaporin family protein [Phnomibacter ginsenosidimutans]|uniref:MIP family channel protein n=1 Tax=Phnomibacter ginsenosidimutans TaxID=2676868 RepID=A0A6I6GGZ1_9BACT|nr:MIP/aquaporin family protein [Phnomibacter ginsenosidimutans]QGW29670.1 MIP family channel protein [Phnomibacter ginsenosidimutans]
MSIFTAELTGTALLLLLGNGVVANVLLPHSKGQGGGWIVISFGWAMAVFVGVFLSASVSGAHLNPAVSLAMAVLGKISWAQLPVYLSAQMLGAMLGSLAVWAVYQRHLLACNDAGLKQAVFCTAPAIPHTLSNLLSETLGTFVLVYAVLYIAAPAATLGALDALPVALLVLAIGLSLGGPTGYAINPARDLGPRIMHALLPMGTKGSSNWAYAWIPVVGPLLGALLAAVLWLW